MKRTLLLFLYLLGGILLGTLLAELAGKYGVSQAQICLRFALDCGVVPLPKSADAGRMRQNLALDFALEAEDLERLRTMPQTGWSGLHPDK